MNKEYKLHKKNIDEEEKTMMRLMDYFEEWMTEKETYQKPKPKVGGRKIRNELDGHNLNLLGQRKSSLLSIDVIETGPKAVVEEGERKRKRKGESKSEKKVKKAPGLAWRRYFLADLTHTNLRLGVAGFFG